AALARAASAMAALAACGGGPAQPAAKPTTKPAGQPAAQPTAAPAQPVTGGDPSKRVTESLGLLTGSGDKTSVLPSYHIEINMAGPIFDRRDKAVKTDTTKIKADVQGANVHVWIEDEDGTTTEGYVIGNDDYVVKDGKVEEGGLSGVGLTWAMWQLDPVIILSLAGQGAQAAGGEDTGGRTAEAYTVDMAKGNPAVLAGIQAFIGHGISNARGQVWIDQQTGALLKTVLDYEQDVYDHTSSEKDAPPVGHGSGHIEISVTQVGKVSVNLPQ
ncbi:MAG TPA: hypothetical protein PLB78_19695, partial [Anaerolineae bacterium]|nr:hypothetical protein [Anaerolineae bacterium]